MWKMQRAGLYLEGSIEMLKTPRKKRSASTIVGWRSNKELVKAASLTLGNEVLQEMIAVVENASPLHGEQLVFGSQVTEHDHSRHLGRIEGYNRALRNLESLAIHQPVPKEPKATYSPPEE
jgi:hypothetical protein